MMRKRLILGFALVVLAAGYIELRLPGPVEACFFNDLIGSPKRAGLMHRG